MTTKLIKMNLLRAQHYVKREGKNNNLKKIGRMWNFFSSYLSEELKFRKPWR